jgi:hypothetical protein
MVWAMVWQQGGKGGALKLVFCKRGPDSPRGGVTSRSYCDVLDEGSRPLYKTGDLFVQDNALVHIKGCTPKWLEEHGIWTINWPPYSPDLNSIEHVWLALKRKIREIKPDFHKLKDNIPYKAWAKEIIQRKGSELDPEHIYRLIESMPRRLATVKKARWLYTYY